MKFLQRLIAILAGTPRPTSDILSDMDKQATELRSRAEFDRKAVADNESREIEMREELELAVDKLEAESKAATDSAERAERVAKRVEEFTI